MFSESIVSDDNDVEFEVSSSVTSSLILSLLSSRRRFSVSVFKDCVEFCLVDCVEFREKDCDEFCEDDCDEFCVEVCDDVCDDKFSLPLR